MSARHLGSALVVSFALLAATGSSNVARADANGDAIETCATAAEHAASSVHDGHLRAAQIDLLACKSSTCPAVIRHDCDELADAVSARLASVDVDARGGSGERLEGARINIDGQDVPGGTIVLDPGDHDVRVERDGDRTSRTKVRLAEGEKGKRVTVVLVPVAAPVVIAAEKPRRGVPVGPIALGAVGALALGSFAYYGTQWNRDVSRMESSCAPNCGLSEVDAARRTGLVADVSLGVGVVALGVATVMFLTGTGSTHPH